MNKVNQIKKVAPELLDNQEVRDAAEQYDNLHKLKALYDTEGGKFLVKTLMQEVVGRLYNLRSNAATLTRDELVAGLTRIDIALDTAKSLMDAEEAMKLIDVELQEALSE